MRPDEHKKKKNAAYKKKHGIGKNAGDSTSDKKDSKVKEKGKSGERKSKDDSRDGAHSGLSGGSRPKQRAGDGRAATSHGDGAKKEDGSSYSSSSSDSEGETQSKSKAPKTFRRREIVSNWQKYELEPDADEKPTARGEDYEKLLSMAGEALSHFRFKDELEWEESKGLSHGSTEDSYSQFLCVNPTHLAQSLACVPVHQVLGISPDVFPTDQLSSITDTAKEKRLVFKESWLDGSEQLINPAEKESLATELPSSTSLHRQQQGDSHATVLSSALKSKPAQHPVSSTLLKPKTENKAVDLSVKSGNSLKTGTAGNVNSGPVSCAAGNDTSGVVIDMKDMSDRTAESKEPLSSGTAKLSLQDDDLDALLNIDTPTPALDAGIKTTQPPPGLFMKDVNSSTKERSGKPSETAKSVKESDELEDWLDSILDD